MYDKATVGNFEQGNLVKCLLGVDDETHSALFKVLSLKELYEEKMSKNCDASDLFTLSFYSVKSSLQLEPLVQKVIPFFIFFFLYLRDILHIAL